MDQADEMQTKMKNSGYSHERTDNGQGVAIAYDCRGNPQIAYYT